MYQDIIVSQANGIARISFNRPSVLNALSPNLIAELTEATQKIAADESVKVLIVTGEGRAWSAGVDLKALNESIQGGQFSNFEVMEMGADFVKTLQAMPQVTIAMVNGFCYTGATEFMLAFDLVYAADEAKIGDTHAKWGIAPKWGMTQRLQQKVGMMKAMELSFTTEAVSGKPSVSD
jgi:enoyl-CoA hydratase/carnithine racemase